MAITFPANPANGETHTHNGQIYVYNSTRGYWLLKKSADISVQQAQRSTFIATASQTTHSVVYDAGSPVVVSVNGVMLNPSDFTAENGTSITFETALTVNDEVDIVFYQPTTSNLTRHSVSDTAPSGASSGDLWFNSANLKTYVYYDDGSSVQWVALNAVGADGAPGSAGSSVTAYANFAAFVNGTTEGDFAFAQDTKALYVWDGNEWDRVYSGPNETLSWVTEPPTNFIVDDITDISMEASDPDGFPVTYSYVTNPANQSSATITNNNNGTFSVVGTGTNTNFTTKFTATDGIHVISKSTAIKFGYSTVAEALADGLGDEIVSFTSGDYYMDANGWVLYASVSNTGKDSTTYPAIAGNQLVWTTLEAAGFTLNNDDGYDGVTGSTNYGGGSGYISFWGNGAASGTIDMTTYNGPSTTFAIRSYFRMYLGSDGHLKINGNIIGTGSMTAASSPYTGYVYETTSWDPAGNTPIWQAYEGSNSVSGFGEIWVKF